MDSGSLGMLIVGSISAIGLIQLIAWIVVVIRNPGLFPSTFGHRTACSAQKEQK